MTVFHTKRVTSLSTTAAKSRQMTMTEGIKLPECKTLNLKRTTKHNHNKHMWWQKDTTVKTVIAYSDKMSRHQNPEDENHPEQPARIKQIYQTLKGQKFFSKKSIEVIGKKNVQQWKVTDDQLKLVHTDEYIQYVKANGSMSDDPEKSVFYNECSGECALIASGLVLELTKRVIEGSAKNGFAVIRPPGHHAGVKTDEGFCLFNHIAVAARSAIRNHGLKRVLVLDWDVHHGNGTQDILYEDDDILFISLHKFGFFYPGTGNMSEIGGKHNDNAKGKNINITFRQAYGDADVLYAFQHVVLPVVSEFNPELVLISAGFDACFGDPLGGSDCSPELFGQLTHLLSQYANGKIVCALEGGYNLEQISRCVAECVNVLVGNKPNPLPTTLSYKGSRKEITQPNEQSPKRCHKESIDKLITKQMPYWKSLKSVLDSDAETDDLAGLMKSLTL